MTKLNEKIMKQARAEQSSIGGRARVEKYGVDSMREIGRKGRAVPSIKRDGYNIARRVLTAHRINILVKYANKKMTCFKCHRSIKPFLRQNIVPHNWNYPTDTIHLCHSCLKKYQPKPIEEGFAEKLLDIHKKPIHNTA